MAKFLRIKIFAIGLDIAIGLEYFATLKFFIVIKCT